MPVLEADVPFCAHGAVEEYRHIVVEPVEPATGGALAGIAGAIVSIGITADSFIVFFERIRDEAREGRSLRSAVESGWTRARRTIIVADMVSILAAVLLYFFAVGGVRGFAFTLGLTTLIDLLIVFIFTKPIVTVIAKWNFFASGHPFSGFSEKSIGRKKTSTPLEA